MPKISIINDEISDDIKEVVAFLKMHKLHYIELRSFGRENIANINIPQLKKYAGYFRKNHIKVSSIASPLLKWEINKMNVGRVKGDSLNSHFYSHNNDSPEKIFEIAEIFQAKYIRIFSFLKYSGFEIADLKQNIEELLLLAKKYNKILLIENEPACNINTAEHLYTFIRYFKSDRIKILFDPGNIYKQGGNLDYNNLSRIKEYIRYVHVKDCSFGNKSYAVLGEGNINYKNFISWMQREADKNIFYSLETHVSSKNRMNETGESLRKLRELLAEERVRYGIVGCGRIFKKHVLAIRDDKGAELIGVFDIDFSKSRQAAQANDCKSYSSLAKLILDVDVINVCTPHHTHAKIIDQVLKSDKYCLCEKPGSISREDIEIVKKNHNYKKKLFIVFQNRYNKTIIKLKDIISKNKLGKIIYIFGGVRWFRPKSYYLKSWQGSRKKEGGMLFNQGIHIIDIIMSVLESGKNVIPLNSIRDRIYHSKISTEDVFIAQLKAGKTLVNLEITVSSLPSNLDSSLFIIFEKGRALVGGKSLESSLSVEAIGHQRGVVLDLPPNADIYGYAHRELIRNLTQYVKTGHKDKNLADYDQACSRIDLINRLYKLTTK